MSLSQRATATNFVAKGNATAPGLGHVHEALFGTVLGINDDFSCLIQSEDWVLAMPGGLLFFQTTSDTFCFTDDANVNLEHGDFTVAGGTGRFAHATGGGSFDETVLTSPQVATGIITLTVTTQQSSAHFGTAPTATRRGVRRVVVGRVPKWDAASCRWRATPMLQIALAIAPTMSTTTASAARPMPTRACVAPGSFRP